MRLWAVVAILLVASSAAARDPKKDRRVAREAQVDASGDVEQVLSSLRDLYGGLEYDQVIPLAEALLAREDLTLEQRLETYRLQGSAKVIVEDPAAAEKPFRLLLRARSDYELPADTPPKILGVFRKVQSEERALAAQLREVERARVVASLRLLGEPPQQAKGGRPLGFSFRVKDPGGAVEAVRVPYRRSGQKAYSALALERAEDGTWRGQIPAEFTADERGFTLEYYLETSDSDGPLLMLGSDAAPRTVSVLAGRLVPASPKPVPPWAWWTCAAVTGGLGVTAGGLGLALNRTQADYRARVSSGAELDGAQLTAQARTGAALATATNVALVAAGAALVTTVVLMPFTRFRDE